MEPSIFWNMMEAIGTIFAALVALILGAGSRIWDRFFYKPDLAFVIESSDPNLSPEERKVFIKITNKGKETARNIRVKLSNVDFQQKGTLNYLGNPFYQQPSLQYGEYDFMILLTLYGDKITIPTVSYPRQNVKFDMLITGDNLKPIKKQISYVDKEEIYKGSVKIT